MSAEGGDATDPASAETLPQHGRAETGEMPLMIDRFVVEDELGAGGMGRVYVAYDPTLDRRVAVKIVRSHVALDAEKAYARMAREARAMARLRHTNVVTVHEVGTDERGVYIVMEYVAGKTLRGWLEHDPPPSWKEIVGHYVLAGRGLAAAHAVGLVHRDFKPDNVLVGDDGRVLVGDFGLVNIYGADSVDEPESGEVGSPRLTRAGSIMGTPPYMAPEQHAGSAVDARTDQFAFCAALYEALYGVRPFAGDTNTEIAERASRGELTLPVRDPGVPSRVRDAILRGLQAKPDHRFPAMQPLLDELAHERRGHGRSLALAAVVAIAVVVAVWLARRGRHSQVPTPQAAVVPAGPIAVEPIAIELPYGDLAQWRDGIGDVLALLLADIDGFKAVGPSNLLAGDHRGGDAAADLRAAEAKIGASYVVRGSIDQRGDRVYAHFELVRTGVAPLVVDVDRPADEVAHLLEDVTNRLASTIAPGHQLDGSHAAIRAQALYAIGDGHLRATRYQLAWPFLEQAVAADPSSFEGWYALALTRSWVLASEPRVIQAVDAARASATTERDRTLADGLSRYLRDDYAGSRAILEPLATNPALSKTELRDALYLLGEASWHDGHHRAGVGYFRRALDVDMTYKLPVQHLGEYAMANRDAATMQQYSLMIASSASDFRDMAEFVLGRYERLARDGTPPTRLWSMLVLGQDPSPQIETELGEDVIYRRIYRTARALEAGDPAAAHTEADGIWKEVEARRSGGELPENVFYMLRMLGDVLVCGGMTDDARRLVGFLAVEARRHPVRNYDRMSILTAPLIGDPTWIRRGEATDRDRQLADAIEAEMAGQHARAADLLAALVHDPSPSWDYPERVALLRNLRALHRGKEARELCEDTLHPAMFQLAFLPVRRICTTP